MTREKLWVIGTGGTIACRNTENGLVPVIPAKELIRKADADKMFRPVVTQLMQKDSTLITWKDVVKIAKEACQASREGLKVLILHGTDTMAYTGALLSFMIRNPKTPIVLTGSMLPPEEKGSDAMTNISDSLAFLKANTPGIYIAFGGKVMVASRATKVHTSSPDAFDTVDGEYVARISNGVVPPIVKQPEAPIGMPKLETRFDGRVVVTRCVPYTPEGYYQALADRGIRGLIVEGFGLGGVPYLTGSGDSGVRIVGGQLSELTGVAKQIPVVLTTQVAHGGIDLGEYEVGRKIADETDIISGGDMTTEAAVTKLGWLLGQQEGKPDVAEIRRQFGISYAGEIKRIGVHPRMEASA